MAAPAPAAASGGGGVSLGGNKKGFDFRMSKKVAELTQVVHMLFTRNHEKEVELEAMKDAYENEITLVIKDARSQLDVLQARQAELEKALAANEETSKMASASAAREDEWRHKVAGLEHQLSEEKKECQSVRDLLIRAQKDIEGLRRGQSTEASRWNREIESREEEMAKLKTLVTTLERRLGDTDAKANTKLTDYQKLVSKLEKEVTDLRDSLQNTDKVKEQYLARNRQLENDIRVLKKELARSERPSTSSKPEPERPSASFMDYAEEIEKLRAQVHRYRMELSNREGNFNRMFVDQRPVVVDRRAGRMSQSPVPDTPHLRYSRDKTVTGSMVMTSSMRSPAATRRNSITATSEEDIRHLVAPVSQPEPFYKSKTPVRSASSSSGRLPNLGLDIRPRGTTVRLAKPKPLSREMLSAKVGGH